MEGRVKDTVAWMSHSAWMARNMRDRVAKRLEDLSLSTKEGFALAVLLVEVDIHITQLESFIHHLCQEPGDAYEPYKMAEDIQALILENMRNQETFVSWSNKPGTKGSRLSDHLGGRLLMTPVYYCNLCGGILTDHIEELDDDSCSCLSQEPDTPLDFKEPWSPTFRDLYPLEYPEHPEEESEYPETD